MKPSFYASLDTSDPEFLIRQEFTGIGYDESSALADLVSMLAANYSPDQLSHLFTYGTLMFSKNSFVTKVIE